MAQYFDIKPVRVAAKPQLHPRRIGAVSLYLYEAPEPKLSNKYKVFGGAGLVIGLVIVGLGIFLKPPASAPVQAVAATQASSDAAHPVAAPNEVAETSWRLIIPSIDVDTAIQAVGLTKEGNMGVPSSYVDVGWFKQGVKPGQPGNAVLAGHLNSGSRKPAVFKDLKKVKIGDRIYVNDKGDVKTFRVTGSQAYDLKSAPLEKIFGGATKSQLNLITCSGNWDKTKKDYDQRLVVFTELTST